MVHVCFLICFQILFWPGWSPFRNQLQSAKKSSFFTSQSLVLQRTRYPGRFLFYLFNHDNDISFLFKPTYAQFIKIIFRPRNLVRLSLYVIQWYVSIEKYWWQSLCFRHPLQVWMYKLSVCRCCWSRWWRGCWWTWWSRGPSYTRCGTTSRSAAGSSSTTSRTTRNRQPTSYHLSANWTSDY